MPPTANFTSGFQALGQCFVARCEVEYVNLPKAKHVNMFLSKP
jgi:hypothetical protein